MKRPVKEEKIEVGNQSVSVLPKEEADKPEMPLLFSPIAPVEKKGLHKTAVLDLDPTPSLPKAFLAASKEKPSMAPFQSKEDGSHYWR